MALNKTPTFVNKPRIALAQILDADVTNPVDVFTAGASGAKVTAAIAAGEDTAARNVQLIIKRASMSNVLQTVAVPQNAGLTNTVGPVNLMGGDLLDILPRDADAQPYLFLEAADVLQVRALTAVTAAKSVQVSVVYGDFDGV
jgi:hypothetical protein